MSQWQPNYLDGRKPCSQYAGNHRVEDLTAYSFVGSHCGGLNKNGTNRSIECDSIRRHGFVWAGVALLDEVWGEVACFEV